MMRSMGGIMGVWTAVLALIGVCCCVALKGAHGVERFRSVTPSAPTILLLMRDGSIRSFGASGRIDRKWDVSALSCRGTRLAYWSEAGGRWRLRVADRLGGSPRTIWTMPRRTQMATDSWWSPSPAAWSPDGRFLAVCAPLWRLTLKASAPIPRVNPGMAADASTGEMDGLLRIDSHGGVPRAWIRPDEDLGDLGAASFESVAWTGDGLWACRAGDLWQITPNSRKAWASGKLPWDFDAECVRSATGTIAGQFADQWQLGYWRVFASGDGRVVGATYGNIKESSPDEDVVLFRPASGDGEQALKEVARLPDQKRGALSGDGRSLVTIDLNYSAWLWRDARGRWVRVRMLARDAESACFVGARSF